MDTEDYVHASSKDYCNFLVDTMVKGKRFDYGYHVSVVKMAPKEARKKRVMQELNVWWTRPMEDQPRSNNNSGTKPLVLG